MAASSVRRLHGDRWIGQMNQPWQIEQPTAANLEAALLQLDGQMHTMLTIEHASGTHMAIAGGTGRYARVVSRKP